jgi:hypothetical protein
MILRIAREIRHIRGERPRTLIIRRRVVVPPLRDGRVRCERRIRMAVAVQRIVVQVWVSEGGLGVDGCHGQVVRRVLWRDGRARGRRPLVDVGEAEAERWVWVAVGHVAVSLYDIAAHEWRHYGVYSWGRKLD